MKYFLPLVLPLFIFASEISLQVLGSGGPELSERASASYLIKNDGKALVLIDFGGGAFLRFGQAKARIEDLEAVLITHLHIDHVVGLPALMKAGYFSNRERPLNILGPKQNNYFPGLTEYINLQFGKNGAYRYMSDILSTQSESFSIYPYEMSSNEVQSFNDIKITAVSVNHGIVPSLAYKVEIEGKSIVFSADTTAHSNALQELAKDSDILVAHHAISTDACLGAKSLHMTPARIAAIAAYAKPKTLLLSHRMNRTLGLEETSSAIIKKTYSGNIIWAEDMMEIE